MKHTTTRRALALMVTVATLAAAFAGAIAPASAALSGTLRLSGSTTVQPLATKLGAKFHALNPKVKVIVTGGGSGVGVTDAEAGRVNLGMSSTDKKTTDPADLVFNRIAKDAVAIIVNPNNHVRKLTTAQVRDIYLGKIKNWKSVGGANAAIILNGRAKPSGTRDYFDQFVLDYPAQAVKRSPAKTMRQWNSTGLCRRAVQLSRYGIGYVSLAYVNRTVVPLTMNNVAASRANVINGRYKLQRYLYFVSKGSATGLRKIFINFARSSTGQSIATSSGYFHY